MVTLLDALYNWAGERPDLTRWLPDEDIRRDYLDSTKYAEEQELALRQKLSGDDLTLFERFRGNQDMANELYGRMIFTQGLSMGLQLGALSSR